MTKKDLIAAIATKADMPKAAAERGLNALIDVVTASLAKGENVTITGFGVFRVSHRKARQGRNPRTGEPIKIKASKVPAFTAGKTFKEQVA